MTRRLYWDDDHCFEAEAHLVAERDGALAFDQTCFYPGGGGQPADQGSVTFRDGRTVAVHTASADAEDVLWHHIDAPVPFATAGEPVHLALNRPRRIAIMRHHTALHVLNSIALRDYEAWITGAQIGEDYSRIDFSFAGLSPSTCKEIERKVNEVLAGNRPLNSYYLPEDEFRNRRDLLRSLEVSPPVHQGRVRVVEIEGFDAQACGGTHVTSTQEVGRLSIFRTENKGRINKRLYVRLD